MNFNSKVVSFERSPAYVHHRAMKNRRENNPLEALELMRNVVEQCPENREYQLDLAELYCELGCHEQSNRILLDMLSQKDAPAECYYGLALNKLGRNEFASARHALELYLRHAGSGEYMQDVDDLFAELAFIQASSKPVSRKKGRAVRIGNKACGMAQAEDPVRACRLFERSLKMDPNQTEIRALYAISLGLCGRMEDAVAQAQQSVSAPEPGARSLCLAAQVFNMAGKTAEARSLADRAISLHPEGIELRLMIFALSELDMHLEAAEAARLAMQETPYDKTLLHMRAVEMHRSGAPASKAASFWKRILRMDPEDTVAAYYYQAAEQGKLDACRIELVYEVPSAEAFRRKLQIAEYLKDGMENAVHLWETDRSFRSLLLWAVNSGDEGIGRAAIMVMALSKQPETESIIRELLFNSMVPTAVKVHGLLFLRLRDADMSRLTPPDMDLRNDLVADTDSMLAEMPVGERQLVRFADEVLAREYGEHALPALIFDWQAYRNMRGSRWDPLVCTQEAAAALAWNYLLKHGRKPSVGELARQFECRPRRMVFYARRMAAVLEYAGGLEIDEHH